MHVKMRSIYQTKDGEFAQPDQVIEVSESEGRELIAGQYAVECRVDRKPAPPIKHEEPSADEKPAADEKPHKGGKR